MRSGFLSKGSAANRAADDQPQLPSPSHTLPTPQAVPAGRFALSTQTAVPVVHEVTPTLQTLTDAHASPGVQATHWPVLHTRSVPHEAPLGLFAPVTQIGAPAAHEMTPTWHRLAGVHAAPAVHAPQVPLPLQTRLVPHDVPAGRLPLATQTGARFTQEIVPI